MPTSAKLLETEISAERAANQETNLPTDAKEYRQWQKGQIASFVIGKHDPSGYLIKKIYSRGDEYVVYEVDGLSEEEAFRTYILTAIEEDPDKIIERFEQIKGEIVAFRSMIYKGIYDKSIKHQAAAAISTALRGDTEKSKEIFKEISERVCAEYENFQQGRINYCAGAFALASIMLIIALIVFGCTNTTDAGKLGEIGSFIYGAAFAGMGGFLSVCINIRGMHFERDLGSWRYGIYGAQRLLISIICGVLACTIVKSGIALSFVLSAPRPTLAILAVCAVAGFSETFIPNSLASMEKKE